MMGLAQWAGPRTGPGVGPGGYRVRFRVRLRPFSDIVRTCLGMLLGPFGIGLGYFLVFLFEHI